MKYPLTVRHLTSAQALRDIAELWDDLWLRSELTHPTAQASHVANWLQHFAPDERFRAVVVEQGGRFLAALPLVARTRGHLVTCMDVPGNHWCSAGQLLLDPLCDTDEVCDVLVSALSELDCSAFWLASVPLEASWWQELVAATQRASWSINERRRFPVGILDLESSGEAQLQRLSSGMRKQLHRSLRRLEASGKVRLHVARPTRGDRALGLLETGLALEHAGWKGEAETSVLSDAVALRFVQDQARQLIERQQLVVAVLEQNGHIVAFEYGWCAKQVYHSYKIAYDPAFRSYSPGHLIFLRLLEHFRENDDGVRAVDFLGPLDVAMSRWRPRRNWVGRLLLAPPRGVGRAVVYASRFFMTADPTPTLV